MATKENPGEHDCHAKARDDEPLFTLIARDPLAPYFVALWAYVREKNFRKAGQVFIDMVRQAETMPAANPRKLAEAHTCAADMVAWWTKNPDA